MKETEGYKAEKEIDSLLYNDKDYFKFNQIKKADVFTLKSAFDEIEVFWNEENRFRPNFSVENDRAKIPVFFANVLGAYNNKYTYFRMIKKFITKDTFVITCDKEDKNKNSIKHLMKYIKNALLSNQFSSNLVNDISNLDNIKNSKHYKYSYLSPTLQDHFFEKLRYVIENEIICIPKHNEFLKIILTSIFDMPNGIIELYKNFDFTKKNPKIIYVSNLDETMSIEEISVIVICHFLGFDILMFSPNGTNLLGNFIDNDLINYYHIGENNNNISIPKKYLNIREVKI